MCVSSSPQNLSHDFPSIAGMVKPDTLMIHWPSVMAQHDQVRQGNAGHYAPGALRPRDDRGPRVRGPDHVSLTSVRSPHHSVVAELEQLEIGDLRRESRLVMVSSDGPPNTRVALACVFLLNCRVCENRRSNAPIGRTGGGSVGTAPPALCSLMIRSCSSATRLASRGQPHPHPGSCQRSMGM
jgi:hypothetical protein